MYIFIITLCICLISMNSCMDFNYNKTVGTVLFSDMDLTRMCWTREDIALLEARMTFQVLLLLYCIIKIILTYKSFQDILPSSHILNVQDENYIQMLMEYFHGVFGVIQGLTTGKAKHIMLMAVSDTMGGYLNSFILPLTKRAFYAGTVSYAGAKKMYDLFDELKSFLKTNGQGWGKPETDFADIPLVVSTKFTCFQNKSQVSLDFYSKPAVNYNIHYQNYFIVHLPSLWCPHR